MLHTPACFYKNQGDKEAKKVHSTKLLAVGNPSEDEIFLRVLPIIDGGYGVYANTVLIAIHTDQAAAVAHCQRLREQQAAD